MEDSIPTVVPGGLPALGPHHVSATRAQAVAAYRAAAAHDPRFAPHAADAFERGVALGEGGMGQVVVARDRRLGREAALKVIQPDLVDATLIRRFEREAEVMARLEHPAIPPLYEAGTDPRGQRYILMRKVEGTPLADVIKRLPRSDRGRLLEVLDGLARAAEAVAYAHGERVVHRDLKPQNVMIGRFGEVTVLDWGLARDVDDRSTVSPATTRAAPKLTLDGDVIGTAGYMPPEQARGDPVGTPADVFALGAILCEVLTGRPPVDGPAMNRLLATIDGRLARPRDRRRDVPPELDSLAAAALAMDPAARPTAAAFAADLRAFLRGEPLATHRYRLRERAVRWARRRADALLVLSLMVTLGGAGALGVVRARAAAAQALAEQRRAVETRDALQRAMDLLAEADALAARGAPTDEVVEVVDRALVIERTRFVLWTAATVCERAALPERARDLLLEAVERFPPALRELGYLHRLAMAQDPAVGMTEWLERLLDAARKAGVRDAMTCFGEGVEAVRRGDWAASARAFEEAARLDPRMTWAWDHLAAARLHLGDHAVAEADATRALDLAPDLTSALLNRATARMALGRSDEALADLDRAASLSPDEPSVWVNRGRTRFERRELDAALGDFDRALALDSDHAGACLARGVTLLRLARPRDALPSLDRAVELARSDPLAWKTRGVARQRLGDLPAALEDHDAALALAPDDREALNNRGLLKAQLGDLPGAEADWTRALELDPDDVSALSNRCLARQKRGDLRGALADGDRALGLDPDHADAWLNRGLTRLKAQDAPGGLADLERFLELAPGHERAPAVRRDVERLRAALGR